MKDKVLCIGEALIDFIPLENGALKNVSSFKKMVGGAPTNVACAISKLGGKARLLTKLGDDAFGEYILDELNHNNVDTTYIIKDKDYDTSLAFVSLDDDGNREFKFYRKTASDLNLEISEVPMKIIEDIGIMYFGSVDLASEKMRDVHKYLLNLAKNHDIKVSFDPNIRLNLWDNEAEYKEVIDSFLEYVDIIKISCDEFEFVTGTNDIDLGIKYLFNKGIKEVLYTMGDKGARVYFSDMTYIESKGIKVDVIDTTGAGDAFMGTYLYFLSSLGKEYLDHKVCAYMGLLLANKCAAYSCMRHGAINSYLSSEDIA